MKIIEILNKIANNEDVPKKIKYDDIVFKLNEYNCYINDDDLIFIDSLTQNLNNLNDEVEIIEDEELKMFEQEWFEENKGIMSIVEVDLAVKINEIIKKVNSIEQK